MTKFNFYCVDAESKINLVFPVFAHSEEEAWDTFDLIAQHYAAKKVNMYVDQMCAAG